MFVFPDRSGYRHFEKIEIVAYLNVHRIQGYSRRRLRNRGLLELNGRMDKSSALKKCRLIVAFLTAICLAWGIAVETAVGGSYRDSAHGSNGYGVDRTSIDPKYAEFATGNCAHCHETHAQLEGSEPAPADGAAAHTLFASSFNTQRIQNPYLETDDFCFYCHSDNSGQRVTNKDYSEVFGGDTSGNGPQSTMAAFNLASYHNLYDIREFLSNDLSYKAWFAKLGNPCSACHNSHLAKRNWDSGQPGFPLLSAISKPGISDRLWGESELMSAYSPSSYEAPYAYMQDREPAMVGDPDGSNTPDYVAFCVACHNQSKIIWSTNLSRDLKKINWENSGLYQNKHGALSRDGSSSFREPYATAAVSKNNFILSCLDCHEAHGSQNTMLLRRRINGENLEGVVASIDAMSYVCKRCHTDDLTADQGTKQADRWEYVHHTVSGAPYAEADCTACHGAGGGNTPIACGSCHGHGMTDEGAPIGLRTGLTTF